jgi:hypothetical protein
MNTIEIAGANPWKWPLEDVNHEGDIDLILHFRTQEPGLTHDSTEGVLIGETTYGVHIEGIDSVRIIPSRER